MRDTLKSKDYFEKCIAYERSRINKFSDTLSSLDVSNEKAIYHGKLYLSNYYINLLKQLYSIGEPIDDVFNCFIMLINYYKDSCSPEDSTHEMIDILSIGVLFYERRAEFIENLRVIMNKFDSSDGFVVNLLNYLENKPVEIIKSKLNYFNELIFSENKQSVLLAELNSWYKHHKGAYWYDSHKTTTDTYYGYWCFEIAALAKLFSVDDSEFKNHPYYPYDLAHQ